MYICTYMYTYTTTNTVLCGTGTGLHQINVPESGPPAPWGRQAASKHQASQQPKQGCCMRTALRGGVEVAKPDSQVPKPSMLRQEAARDTKAGFLNQNRPSQHKPIRQAHAAIIRHLDIRDRGPTTDQFKIGADQDTTLALYFAALALFWRCFLRRLVFERFRFLIVCVVFLGVGVVFSAVALYFWSFEAVWCPELLISC